MSCVGRVRANQSGDFVIVAMTAHDLIEVVELEESCGLSLWGWDSYHSELSRPESIMLVARKSFQVADGGRTVRGFLSARIAASELHVNNIGVREDARRKGLGGALLTAAFKAGAVRGASSAVLEVRAGNLAAQALYRRYGFGAAGRRRNYYRQPQEDALVMRASIKPGG